jgi:predicted kinase
MDYTDGKTLLNILKPKKGDAPSFGEIPFDNIIFEALKSSSSASPSTAGEPNVLILCGPPGCGKSTVKTNLLAEFKIDNYINIDPDEIRTILMANGVTFPADKTTMPGITNAFNKRMSDEAQKQHLNIVFDTTGQNFRAVSDLLYTSRQLGYKSYFSIIWASLETCRRRIEGRNQYLRESSSGRIQLPIEVAEGIYNGFVQPKGTASMLLLDYPVRANEVFLYNNNVDGAEPQLLYHKVGDNVEFSTNFSGFYNMNLSVEAPYISKSSSGGKRRRKAPGNMSHGTGKPFGKTKKRRSHKKRRTYKRK